MMKVWKSSVLVGLLVLLSGLTYAQSYAVDTARLAQAEDRLAELLEVDKDYLNKAEKKAWKREKKQQKRIIAHEREKIRFNQEMEFRWRYGQPFYNGFYAYNFGVWGNPYGRFYRRPVVVRNQRCRVVRSGR